ncbi:DUF2199 domain-containing protein [Anderseniella sp. Alg231-50]|uniref:DUF2199 domain-containing protein n=1 Tax=Anderseniella sp. Alg231-50 TaxID=1922226 RepID=UPI000D5607E6
MDLTIDSRWSLLSSGDWRCPCCGLQHNGVFDLACDAPDFWQGSREWLPNEKLFSSDNILTEDFCIIDGENFFIRCVLELPLLGSDGQTFGFGVWSTLSKTNFDICVNTFDDGKQGHLGPWFGWFSNRLKGYPDTLNMKCQVYPLDERQRPTIELESSDHPLAAAQADGIDFDQLLDIYAANDHDIRPAL